MKKLAPDVRLRFRSATEPMTLRNRKRGMRAEPPHSIIRPATADFQHSGLIRHSGFGILV
jgi:hypothetical protein